MVSLVGKRQLQSHLQERFNFQKRHFRAKTKILLNFRKNLSWGRIKTWLWLEKFNNLSQKEKKVETDQRVKVKKALSEPVRLSGNRGPG